MLYLRTFNVKLVGGTLRKHTQGRARSQGNSSAKIYLNNHCSKANNAVHILQPFFMVTETWRQKQPKMIKTSCNVAPRRFTFIIRRPKFKQCWHKSVDCWSPFRLRIAVNHETISRYELLPQINETRRNASEWHATNRYVIIYTS